MNEEIPAGVQVSLAELLALRVHAQCKHVYAHVRRLCAAGPRGSTVMLAPGLDYAETRAYQAGDDRRHIDWRQSARRGRMHTKLFREERSPALHLVVDLGSGMRFGTRIAFKSVAAARAAAGLAWLAERTGAAVGATLWDGSSAHSIAHERVPAILERLAAATGAAPAAGGDLYAALGSFTPRVPSGATLVVFSDFADPQRLHTPAMHALARRCSLVLVQVVDPFESAPPPGRYGVDDGVRRTELDLRSPARHERYLADFAARQARLRASAARLPAALLSMQAGDAIPVFLQRFRSVAPWWGRVEHAT